MKACIQRLKALCFKKPEKKKGKRGKRGESKGKDEEEKKQT